MFQWASICFCLETLPVFLLYMLQKRNINYTPNKNTFSSPIDFQACTAIINHSGFLRPNDKVMKTMTLPWNIYQGIPVFFQYHFLYPWKAIKSQNKYCTL